ncbi:MAG: hypothetical protein KF726_05185 [Anaerolineae bacterium]|nr:hypothetical protein [Anaerolineae bacterium]
MVQASFSARSCRALFDYHPQVDPAPYNHSARIRYEVLYYVEGNFA